MFYLSEDLYVILRDYDTEYISDSDLEIYNDYDEAIAEAERLTSEETEEWLKKNPEKDGNDWRPSYLRFVVLPISDAIKRRLDVISESAYDDGVDSGRESGYEDGYVQGFKDGERDKEAAYDDGYQQGLEDGKQQSSTE